MVAHTLNPITREAGRSEFKVGQPTPQSEYQDSQGNTDKPYLKREADRETFSNMQVRIEKKHVLFTNQDSI